ncbi:hypothetical protein FRC11_014631 [Ceratobasidium sp. 423]|nr:hypothetical protein FRC11_014631 [Ceratobasidium sp. 423]
MSLPFDSVLEESQRAAMDQHPVPAFGRTRCYWSLLDSELKYLYLDPTCFVHMGEQAEKIIGTCLLEYVHPDEHKSARADLRKVLDSRTLDGSVTRVRYARLSRIREILGCNAPDPFPDADLVTVDDHYIACDVVINWVSDNVVLCFLHAIVDKGKADNDEFNKTHWTNWCGTSAMTTDHAAGLYDRLHKLVPPSQTPPDRIFQILINQPARPILFSWPPEGYTAGEFSKLVHRMEIEGPRGPSHSKRDDGAKTSCTRRYKAYQQIIDRGVLKEVESIFIPHGAVIFACHKVVPPRSPYPSIQQGRASASDMYHGYQPRQPVASGYPPQSHQHPLVQGNYTSDARRGAGNYSAPGVPDSPEYAHSRVTNAGYQRGPAEYSASQYAVRDVDYAHGPNYVQQYDPPYPASTNQQRSEVYTPVQHPTGHRSSQDRADGWGYAQSQPQHPPATQTPAQLSWPAPANSPRPASPRSQGPSSYEGQSWMMPQGWTQGPMEQTPAPQHQPQQGYPYPTPQPFGPPSIPGQPQQQPLSPPPPYAPNTPISQPPPPLDTPVSAKREPSPQEEDTTIPRIHAPPKRKRGSVPKRETNGTLDLASGDGGRSQLSPPTKDVISRERGNNTGATAPRAGGGPPPGIQRCSSCKSESSPEWRKGPSGKKDLCNACGLRYARSKQKKDGNAQPKRRREKEIPLAPAPVPIPGGVPSGLQSSHGPLSTSASTSSSSAPPSWPNAPPDNRDQKRMRGDGLTAVSHSPSPPRSEGRSQPEHYPEAYGARYGQTVYPQGYTNGYNMDYTRVPGSVPSYTTPDLPPNDRAFAGH